MEVLKRRGVISEKLRLSSRCCCIVLLARFLIRLQIVDRFSRSSGSASSMMNKINSLGRLKKVAISRGKFGVREVVSVDL